MISDLEKAILAEIQGDLPVEPRPFLTIARKLSLTEEQVLTCIRDLTEKGVIRRFGVTIRHQVSGFEANAMAAFKVEEERTDEVGVMISEYPQVTHCYRRTPMGGWKYNLFAMIHGDSQEVCERIAGEIAERAGVFEYRLLYSDEEHKKTSMRYF